MQYLKYVLYVNNNLFQPILFNVFYPAAHCVYKMEHQTFYSSHQVNVSTQVSAFHRLGRTLITSEQQYCPMHSTRHAGKTNPPPPPECCTRFVCYVLRHAVAYMGPQPGLTQLQAHRLLDYMNESSVSQQVPVSAPSSDCRANKQHVTYIHRRKTLVLAVVLQTFFSSRFRLLHLRDLSIHCDIKR